MRPFRARLGLVPATLGRVCLLAALVGTSLPGCGGGKVQPEADAGPAEELAPTVDVRVLSFNDFHGALDPPTGSAATYYGVPTGGAVYLAAHVAAVKKAQPNTVVVSVGDLVGASAPMSAMFHDEPTIEVMALLGLDLAALGNHEFDKGVPELRRLAAGGCHPVDGCQDGTPYAGAPFPFLTTNVWDPAAGQTLFAPYEVRAFDGIRLAFVGTAPAWTPDIVGLADLAGVEFRDEVASINATVALLREQGIEAFVVLAHQGGYGGGGPTECPAISADLAAFVAALDPAVDAVLGGHSHAAYNCRVGTRVVTAAGSRGQLFTDLALTLERSSGDVVAMTATNQLTTRDLTPSAEVEALIARYRNLATPILHAVVGTITASLTREVSPAGECSLGSVVADGMLSATRGAGAVAALMSQSSLRSDLRYLRYVWETADGQVTLLETMNVLPYQDSLVTLDLAGEELVATLEQQGLSVSTGVEYTWDAAKPAGSQIDVATFRIGGAALELQKMYRVTVSDYMLRGGADYQALVAERHAEVGAGDVEAFSSYLRANSPVSPPAPRVVRLN